MWRAQRRWAAVETCPAANHNESRAAQLSACILRKGRCRRRQPQQQPCRARRPAVQVTVAAAEGELAGSGGSGAGPEAAVAAAAVAMAVAVAARARRERTSVRRRTLTIVKCLWPLAPTATVKRRGESLLGGSESQFVREVSKSCRLTRSTTIQMMNEELREGRLRGEGSLHARELRAL